MFNRGDATEKGDQEHLKIFLSRVRQQYNKPFKDSSVLELSTSNRGQSPSSGSAAGISRHTAIGGSSEAR